MGRNLLYLQMDTVLAGKERRKRKKERERAEIELGLVQRVETRV